MMPTPEIYCFLVDQVMVRMRKLMVTCLRLLSRDWNGLYLREHKNVFPVGTKMIRY